MGIGKKTSAGRCAPLRWRSDTERPWRIRADVRAIAAVTVAIVFLALFAAAARAQGDTTAVVAETTDGALSGAASGSIARFLGIPYAEPPVGALRWRLPQPRARWQDTRAATRFGAICPQPGGADPLPPASEDCLFLNVYAPFPLRPGHAVMVWIHGGTNTTGAGSFYDPVPLVATGDVVVVTLNYRLGALGFLAHPALAAESGTSGDYGLADQQLALRWVHDNIAAFGGDPRNVTLFGESSGGLNVLSQLVSPSSAGLFQKAIVESGAFGLDTQDLAASEAQGRSFARAIGCADQSAACLRGQPTAEVLAHQGNPDAGRVAYALATVDGKILPLSQRAALARGRFHRVPVLFGNNAQEGRLFVPATLSAADYRATLAGYARAVHRPVPGVLRRYPLAAYATPAAGAAAAYGDSSFACPDRVVARLVGRRVRAFEYEFDDIQGTAPLGPTHGAELRYLFSVQFVGPGFDGSPSQLPAPSQALARAMRRYWTGFARRGTPAQPDLPDWKDVSRRAVQMLVAPQPHRVTSTAFAVRHKCAYWN